MKNLIDTFKRWGVAFIAGGLIGMILQQNLFFYEIETDCKYMKSFRHKQFVYDCVERKAL
jgi:hypothetical protein